MSRLYPIVNRGGIALAALALFVALGDAATRSPAPWATLNLVSEGTEPAAARLIPVDADRNERASPWVRSLNGAWRFKWNTSADERDRTFHRPTSDVSAWADIVVPSNWEAVGFGRRDVDVEAGVGSYRRRVRVDEAWQGREIFLRFERLGPGAIVWWNGERIGYAEADKQAVEFRVTRAAKIGDNVLAVQVFGHPAGARGWLSGLDGDVSLYATPKLRFGDVDVRATFDPDSLVGRARVVVRLDNRGPTVDAPIDASLRRGERSWPFPSDVVHAESGSPALHVFELDIPGATPWSAETPALYHLDLVVGDETPHRLSIPVGFSKIERVGGRLHVNGRPVRLRGVGRRGAHPDFGYVVPEDAMRRDIAAMKAAHVNAVWAEGIPFSDRWLSLCDAAGLYVVDAPTVGPSLGEPADSIGVAAAEDRVRRLLRSGANHPSVLAWALDESHRSADHLVRERGDQRIDLGHASDDVEFASDPSPADVDRAVGRADGRSVVLVPSATMAGNSLGGFSALAKSADAYDAVIGGFVSTWVDDPWRSPGVARGLIDRSGAARAPLHEVRSVYQPIRMSAPDLEAGRFVLTNGRAHRPLSGAFVAWSVAADGAIGLTDTLALPEVAPAESFEFEIATDAIEPEPGREYVLAFTTLEDGRTLGTHEFVLPIFRSPAAAEATDTPLTVTTRADTLVVEGDGFVVHVDRSRGEWIGYEFRDRPMLARAPRVSLWRLPTDIDRATGAAVADAVWRSATEAPVFDGFEVTDTSDRWVKMSTRYAFPQTDGQFAVTTTVHANGDVDLEARIRPGTADSSPPRVGLDLIVPSTFTRTRWFGLGPHESYPDRARSGRLALHERRATDPRPDYVSDQERGNLAEVRWMTLTDDDGIGWLAVGESMVSANAFAVDDGVRWRLDAASRGVGGSAARGIEPALQADAEVYDLNVRFRPHADDVHDMHQRARATRER